MQMTLAGTAPANATDIDLAHAVERYMSLLGGHGDLRPSRLGRLRHQQRRKDAVAVQARALHVEIVELSKRSGTGGAPAPSSCAVMAAIGQLASDPATRSAARPLMYSSAIAGTANVLCAAALFSTALQRWGVTFADVATLVGRLEEPSVASMYELVEQTNPSTRWQLTGRVGIESALAADDDDTYRKARLACALTDRLGAGQGARAVFDVLVADAGHVGDQRELAALIDAACDVTTAVSPLR